MSEVNTISPVYNASTILDNNMPASVRQNAAFTSTLNQKLKSPSNLESIFQDASERYQVPVSLLKAVAKAESDFNPKCVSSAGAQGVMQLMPGTAKGLGVTDPFDPKQTIMGGAKYLRTMLDRYDGDTKLALAAYNAGSGNVAKYGGIPPFKETQNYVAKVMKYAGSDISANIPASVSTADASAYRASSTDRSYAPSRTQTDLLQNILDFDNFSTDDYLLFLELIKNNLQAPNIDGSIADSSNSMNDFLNQSRVLNLY